MREKDLFKIHRKKGDICPVCQKYLRGSNYWVRYHIRYSPTPLVIVACRYCNYTEWALRNGKVSRLRVADPSRIYQVLNFHKKFEILNNK